MSVHEVVEIFEKTKEGSNNIVNYLNSLERRSVSNIIVNEYPNCLELHLLYNGVKN